MIRTPDPEEVRLRSRKARAAGLAVAFVPTMGYFHEGHLSLIHHARTMGEFVVVSIFVNPTQFGEGEDLGRYPTDLDQDERLALQEEVDLLFVPEAECMYPAGYRTRVSTEGLDAVLCGAARPTHFAGVTTVVAKLLNIVEPDALLLGRKDAQQAIILRRMVEDLNFPCEVVVCPTVREHDGLAMSSRNSYLGPEEREQARALYLGLERAKQLVLQGERSTQALVSAIRDELERWPLVLPEYVVAVETSGLEPVQSIHGEVLLAVAAQVGPARLIDNAMVRIGPQGVEVEL
jgi:pantoate--beta-alanine ligase